MEFGEKPGDGLETDGGQKYALKISLNIIQSRFYTLD